MRIEGYEAGPLDAGELMLSRPGAWHDPAWTSPLSS